MIKQSSQLFKIVIFHRNSINLSLHLEVWMKKMLTNHMIMTNIILIKSQYRSVRFQDKWDLKKRQKQKNKLIIFQQNFIGNLKSLIHRFNIQKQRVVQKKKLTRPKEIILGYRENLDQLMKHQIATNININNPTITVNNQTSDIQRSLSDIDVRIEDTSKMRTPKPENNNPEKNITDQHCYFHKPQSKTINDQEELDIRSYSSPSQNCINQQQRKGSRYENKINFEYQLDMAQNSQKQLNDLIKGDINILLVGNNQYISQSFPKLLQEIEKIKKIDVAQNKQQIFEQLDKNFTTATQQCDYYKFIFLDNDIPDEDIYEITKSIKLKILGNQFTAKYTKLIMLLQKNDITQQKRSATDVGADSYQLKPMTLSNLIKTCKQFLA
eukprot:TRINITY_DN734_c0_g3_i1.p2 TRINITY_DN734_c0_g3~~TRINITY_DN734_c0_g3_i1.p2  ORF type:complete len:382 (+),score=61.24 TRINITY_DN734_c0_g3_i1:924-2069(+)